MEGQKTISANENLSSLNKLGNLFVNNEKNNLNRKWGTCFTGKN